jgi:multidrug resistance efflux pump
VHRGEVIAQVLVSDPQLLESSLSVIQAEIQLLRLNLRPTADQPPETLQYDHLRLDWMDQRVQLATARARLQLADADLRRLEDTSKGRSDNEQALDAARSTQATLQSQVSEFEKLVARREKHLKELAPAASDTAVSSTASAVDLVRASISVQERRLRLAEAELSPINVTVNMDATVSSIHHRSGESILAGEPIVTLTALTSDRVLGYVRQPLAFQPQVGMKVEIRPRSSALCISQAEVLEVGNQMESISGAFSQPTTGRSHQLGLPVRVSLPHGQNLSPGEIVELRMVTAKPLVYSQEPKSTETR